VEPLEADGKRGMQPKIKRAATILGMQMSKEDWKHKDGKAR